MPRSGSITCEICDGRASHHDQGKRIFMAKFPLDEARCKQWVKAVGKDDLIYVPIEKLHEFKYVCGLHFGDEDFNKKKSRLKLSAVPTINLMANPLPDEMLNNFPFHVYKASELYRSSSQDEGEGAALPSNSELYTPPGQQLSSQCEGAALPSNSEPSTSGYDYSNCAKKEQNQSRKRKKTFRPESSTSSQHVDHSYFTKNDHIVQSHKRKGVPELDLELAPRKLMKELRLCQRKKSVLRQGNIMPRIKSLALKTLIKAYLRNHGRARQGQRWTSLDKALAIAIYNKSPHTYRHLQHQISLPSIRALQTLFQGIELEPGISQTMMEHLKKKAAKLNENDRLCALLFDKIALKKHLIFNPRTDKVEGYVDLGDDQCRSSELANHALVFMLQGLHQKLKKPIAYYFVKGTISSQRLAILIINVIRAITDIGYTVVTTVCNQGSTNIGGLNLLKEWCGIPSELNYFLLDNVKVFIMFDIPHLFKAVRNNFHNGGEIVIDGKRGKWSHLVDLEIRNKSTLHFKKITAQHVNPKFRSKIKVKLAAQVLSNTVAAILKLMAETYGDDEKTKEILETALVIEDLDRLFDCTNGPASSKDIIKHRRENVSKKTSHLKLWNHYKKKMSTVHFLTAGSFLRLKNVRCIQGYIISLSSLEDIWNYVESKGFKYLNLRQLNQDCLENLFGMIRQHCPTYLNPTCHHFTSALKSNILTKFSMPVGKGEYCEENKNEAVINFEDLIQNPVKRQPPENFLEETTEFCELAEAPVLHLPEVADAFLQLHDDVNFDPLHLSDDLQLEIGLFESLDKPPTVYVAGYLASVVLTNIKWKCENCKISLKIEDPELCSTQMYSYINLREWWQDKKSLTYPTVNLCQLVDTATSCFDTVIKPILHEKHISNQAVTMMLTKCDNLQWLCHDHKSQLLHTLLVRLSYLLIRNECHRMNLSLAESQESTADIAKKARLQALSK